MLVRKGKGAILNKREPNMTFFSSPTAAALFACAAMFSMANAHAQTMTASGPADASKTFKPFKLIGEWTFRNGETGTVYSGAVGVNVNGETGVGRMRGTVSYDGRQTNDSCNTKGLFSDDPVEADILKTEQGYDISFSLKCAKGESPRARKFKLSCENRVCSEQSVLPHGKGAIKLQEGS